MRNLLDKAFLEPLDRLNQQFARILPDLMTVLFILIIGGALAYLLRQLTYRMLCAVGWDRLLAQTATGSMIRRSGAFRSPSDFAARVVQGFVWLIFILVALTALDTELTRNLMVRFVNYVPAIITALLMLLLGSLVSKFLARAALLAAVNAQWSGARLIAGGVRLLVMSLTVLIALEQLRIGSTALLVSFAILFAGFVVAAAIAFGLAGKEVARDWLLARTRPRPEEEEVVRHL